MNKTTLIALISLLTACSSGQDYSLLKTYITGLKKENNIDVVFLAENNSNSEIFKKYDRVLKNDLNLSDSLASKLFSKNEYNNYKRQVVNDNSKWDFDKLDYIYPSKEAKEQSTILFVSKPIYTMDKKYALMYSYSKGKDGVYFIPPIDVYYKKQSVWVKVGMIKDTGFKRD